MCCRKYITLVLSLGLTLTGCKPPAADLSALQDELAALKSRFELERKQAVKLRAELEAFATFKDKVSTSLSDFNRQQREAMAAMDGIKDEFMSYRDEYKVNVRTRAAGMNIPDFEALGRIFRKIVVKSVDDWEIAFNHANGISRMNLADAPAEIRILFAYNPNVGPKPPPPPKMPNVLASAGLTEEDLTAFPELASATQGAGTGTGPGTTRGAGSGVGSGAPGGLDPFANPPPTMSVGKAIGLPPSLAGKESPTFKKNSRPTRRVVFRDGSVCELLGDW